MHDFVRGLITEWRKLELPFAGDTIVVGVSGGADSLALLLAIHDLFAAGKLGSKLVAAHFNHRLRGSESDEDEEFVRSVTSDRGISLAVERGDIDQHGNIEQNARNARYAFLERLAGRMRARVVLTAHTVDDQAETFLLNLIRGSGRDGLSAMPPVRPLGSGPPARHGEEAATPIASDPSDEASEPELPFTGPLLVRPLLRWARRADTENYCRVADVKFRMDTMNEDMSFKRVRVRLMLLPMLREFNPNIVETLAATAELLAVPDVPDASAASQPIAVELSIRDLRSLTHDEILSTIRNWLRGRRGSLRSVSRKHIEAIASLAASPKSGRVVELPGRGTVTRSRGRLSFKQIMVDK